MGISLVTLHNWYKGEFEEPTTLDVINNTPYRLVLKSSNYIRGQILSYRGKAIDKVPSRQGVPINLIRIRADRTGEEQPLWLKSNDELALYITLCYSLMQGGVDSSFKLVIKLFRPEKGQPRLQARLVKHHSAEQCINAITDEHTDDQGSTVVSTGAGDISFQWKGGRPCLIRMERVVPGVQIEQSAPNTFEVEVTS